MFPAPRLNSLLWMCPHQWLTVCVVWEPVTKCWYLSDTHTLKNPGGLSHLQPAATWIPHKPHLFRSLSFLRNKRPTGDLRACAAHPHDPVQSCAAFLLSVPLKATEGFVWEGSARSLDFGYSGELCSPDVPFDQVTPSPSVLIIHRQGCDSNRASMAELQAYLWTIQRLSQDRSHQMLRVTCLPALYQRQLGFLSLPFFNPSVPWLSLFLSLQVIGLAQAPSLTEVSWKASGSLKMILIILIFTL